MTTTNTSAAITAYETTTEQRSAAREAYRAAHGHACDLGFAPDWAWLEGFICAARGAAQAAPVDAARYLGSADLADLRRIEDLFDDGEGHDLPKSRMVRLTELGVIRHHGGGYYSITAFGRLASGGSFARLPLETVDERNDRISKEHQAAIAARAAQEGK